MEQIDNLYSGFVSGYARVERALEHVFRHFDGAAPVTRRSWHVFRAVPENPGAPR